PHKGAFRTDRKANTANAAQTAISHHARLRRLKIQAKALTANSTKSAAWSQPSGVGFHSSISGRSQSTLPTNHRNSSAPHGLQSIANPATTTAPHKIPTKPILPPGDFSFRSPFDGDCNGGTPTFDRASNAPPLP